jgi:ABC-type lipoprotein release transport system permease subunit
VVAIIFAVTLATCLPARRIAGIDPTQSLRYS